MKKLIFAAMLSVPVMVWAQTSPPENGGNNGCDVDDPFCTVPEPSTLALLGIGAIGAAASGVVAKRRRKNK